MQCISGWVLRESQTDGTSINGTRTVWTQKSQKAGRYNAAVRRPIMYAVAPAVPDKSLTATTLLRRSLTLGWVRAACFRPCPAAP